MKEIYRKCFGSLCKEGYHHYFILCDGNYESDFYADSDSEAIEDFEMETKGDQL